MSAFFNFSKAVVTESPKLDELTDDEFSESSLFGDNKGAGPSSSESSSKLSLQCKGSGAVGLYGGVGKSCESSIGGSGGSFGFK